MFSRGIFGYSRKANICLRPLREIIKIQHMNFISRSGESEAELLDMIQGEVTGNRVQGHLVNISTYQGVGVVNGVTDAKVSIIHRN